MSDTFSFREKFIWFRLGGRAPYVKYAEGTTLKKTLKKSVFCLLAVLAHELYLVLAHLMAGLTDFDISVLTYSTSR